MLSRTHTKWESYKTDPAKTEAVQRFPTPKNVKNIREFLELAGYYRRFIHNFAKIAKPLTILLQKDNKFFWNTEQQEAFIKLKEILCNAPILQYPKFDEPYVITTDASKYALGAVPSQAEIGKDRRIAYASRVLQEAEIKYDTYEKEALAIMFAIKTFRNYIYGKKFTIVTDHKPLFWLKTADNKTRVQKWRLKLSDYEYDIAYKPARAQGKKEISKNSTPAKILNKDKVEASTDNHIKVKGKRGRPRKNIQEPLAQETTSNSNNKGKTTKRKEEEDKTEKDNIQEQEQKNLIYTKNSIQFRNDNIVHIITQQGGAQNDESSIDRKDHQNNKADLLDHLNQPWLTHPNHPKSGVRCKTAHKNHWRFLEKRGILDSFKDESEHLSKEELDDAKAQFDEAIKVFNKEHAHFEVVWTTSQANHPYFTDDCHYQMQQIGTMAKKIIAKRSAELPAQTTAQPGKVTCSKSKLPDIELPRFTGNYTEWSSFLELFNSVVCGKPELKQVEKFYCLKGCLRGEPAQIVSSLPLIGASLSAAIELLKQRCTERWTARRRSDGSPRLESQLSTHRLRSSWSLSHPGSGRWSTSQTIRPEVLLRSLRRQSPLNHELSPQ
ncbi:uncharacterized protein LOC117611214 [Osmia lignaria lignaria]|uniref:uncharacterized protein LOC117611214 n=1 Tax=Osmia lignaria lignaria TaxID=1437193 RepID=UPI00402B6ABC